MRPINRNDEHPAVRNRYTGALAIFSHIRFISHKASVSVRPRLSPRARPANGLSLRLPRFSINTSLESLAAVDDDFRFALHRWPTRPPDRKYYPGRMPTKQFHRRLAACRRGRQSNIRLRLLFSHRARSGKAAFISGTIHGSDRATLAKKASASVVSCKAIIIAIAIRAMHSSAADNDAFTQHAAISRAGGFLFLFVAHAADLADDSATIFTK